VAPFQVQKRLQYVRRQDGVAGLQPRRERLRKRARIDHEFIARIEALHARQVHAGIAQFAIGRVFEDQNAMIGAKPTRQFDQLGPPFLAQGQTGWVLEVIDRVDHFDFSQFA
jgi:hypothetical protein